MLEYASSLCKTAPVYYITGNHERRLDDFEELMQELSNAGFNVLLNECVHNDELNLSILGLDENQADFEDYKATKERIYADYEDRMTWAKKMLINISKAGFFSSDRTIAQYNEDIWHLS